jgi:hypothetical protein
VLPVLFRCQFRRIITEAVTTDITTEGITTDIIITDTIIGTGPGLSASMGVQGIIAIGKRIIVRAALHHSLKGRAQSPAIDSTYDVL